MFRTRDMVVGGAHMYSTAIREQVACNTEAALLFPLRSIIFNATAVRTAAAAHDAIMIMIDTK